MSAVSLVGVGKRYRKYEDSAVLIARGRRQLRRTKRSDLWALRDIDLEVAAGECLGVIGRNGGGKTTMLQLLAGISAPTCGTVSVRGRVAPLMAVGVGFHPELTGHENVYVNATILGMERSEIDAAFADIVAFSEVEDFIATPVKFYSSGMLLRLGMAIAVRSHAEVLLVDEVLAVGDVAFQAKCFDRMQEVQASGTTVIVVSHNLNAVRMLCDRTLVLSEGRAAFLGDTTEAISLYHDQLGEEREPEDVGVEEPEVAGDGARIQAIALFDQADVRTSNLTHGEVARLAMRVVLRDPSLGPPMLVLDVTTGGGQAIYHDRLSLAPPELWEGRMASVDLRLPVALPTGTYRVELRLADPVSGTDLFAAAPIFFYVRGRPGLHGHADLSPRFERARASQP